MLSQVTALPLTAQTTKNGGMGITPTPESTTL